MITVRPGAPSDFALVGKLHTISRQAAYRGMVSQDLLDAMDPEENAQAWRDLYQEHHWFCLAFDDAEPVGFSYIAEGWLRAIHVLPHWHGIGAGVALMAAARQALRDSGFDRGRLWVVAENARARRFYERDGWKPTGLTRDKPISGGMTTQLEYVCDL